jgi:flagellin-like protein
MSEKLRNRRGLSPVIATVVLVVVAITVALAIAYWIGGIRDQYTRFEHATIKSVTYDSKNTIAVKIRNTGTIDLNVIEIKLNDESCSFNGTSVLEPNEESTLTLCNVGWTSGKKYRITILTSNKSIFIKETKAP